MKQKGWNSVLISDIELPVNLSRATSNITNADIIPLRGLNVYDILRREMLILTKAAAERIQKRLLNRTPHILKMAYKNSLKRQGISLPEVTTQKV
jgi:ribosomal protein L4